MQTIYSNLSQFQMRLTTKKQIPWLLIQLRKMLRMKLMLIRLLIVQWLRMNLKINKNRLKALYKLLNRLQQRQKKQLNKQSQPQHKKNQLLLAQLVQILHLDQPLKVNRLLKMQDKNQKMLRKRYQKMRIRQTTLSHLQNKVLSRQLIS